MVQKTAEDLDTLTHVIKLTLPAGTGATTDVIETLGDALHIPGTAAEQQLYLAAAYFSPSGALGADAVNYHHIQIAAYDTSGVAVAGNPILDAQLKSALVKWASQSVLSAENTQKLADGASLTYKTTHTGTPAAAFPGGRLTLVFHADLDS